MFGKQEKSNTASFSAAHDWDGPGKIRARVIDAKDGLRVISGIRAVRIHSKGYNLLIMEDYLPALGKVEGNVTLLTQEQEIPMQQIRGFYKLQHNEFTLLIEEQEEPASPAETGNEGSEA